VTKQLFLEALQQQLMSAKNLTRKQMEELIDSLLELRKEITKDEYIWALDVAIEDLINQRDAAQCIEDNLIRSLEKYGDKGFATYNSWQNMNPHELAKSAWRELRTITETDYRLISIDPNREKLEHYANLLIEFLKYHIDSYIDNPNSIFNKILENWINSCDIYIQTLTKGEENKESKELVGYYEFSKKIIQQFLVASSTSTPLTSGTSTTNS